MRERGFEETESAIHASLPNFPGVIALPCLYFQAAPCKRSASDLSSPD